MKLVVRIRRARIYSDKVLAIGILAGRGINLNREAVLFGHIDRTKVLEANLLDGATDAETKLAFAHGGQSGRTAIVTPLEGKRRPALNLRCSRRRAKRELGDSSEGGGKDAGERKLHGFDGKKRATESKKKTD